MTTVDACFLFLLGFLGTGFAKRCRRGERSGNQWYEDCDDNKLRDGDHDDIDNDDDNDDDDDDGDRTGLVVGLVVGCVLLIVLLALCALAVRRFRRRGMSKTAQRADGDTSGRAAVYATPSPPVWDSPPNASLPAPHVVESGNGPAPALYDRLQWNMPAPPPYTEPHYDNDGSLPPPLPSKGVSARDVDPPPPYPAHEIETNTFVQSSAPPMDISNDGQTKY